MGKRQEVIGEKFGLVTVLADAGYEKCGRIRRVLGRCDCGVEKTFRLSALKASKKANCGCYARAKFIERQTKHGLGRSRLYKIWHGMKSRCYNEKDIKYPTYGARGISVCEEWLNDINEFIKWANENGYKDNLTIDRINNDEGYSPNNCRWVDIKTQNQNRRTCWKITINGVTKLAIEWAKENGISETTPFARRKRGWSDIDCVTIPVKRKGAK